MKYSSAIHLRTIAVSQSGQQGQGFPFNVPIIQSMKSLEFSSQVTFFVGENGCGKSTLLETIACAAGSITVGSESVETDKTLASVRLLARNFKLTWSKRTRRGFFMRSEDFFGYARKMTGTREELQQNLDDIEKDYVGRSEMAKAYARSAYAGQIGAMKRDYGEDLDAHSHGESYLKLFQARFVPGGLYILDEPEAPLSPLRQLSFLAMLKKMVDQEAQFLIATHSPILMAYPGAMILNCDGGKIAPVAYDDLEHVRITKSFLNNPESYLRHLME